MNLLGKGTVSASGAIRGIQSGNIQKYTVWFLGGALGLIVVLLLF